MIGEHNHEEYAACETIQVEQSEQVAVVHAFRINGNAPEQVGERHPEKQRRQEIAQEKTDIPHAAPQPAVDLIAEFKGYRTENQGEEQNEQRSVERAEHGGISQGEGREGHAASGDQPYFVAVPERAGGIVDNAFFRIATGQEGHERTHTEIESVKNEVDGP